MKLSAVVTSHNNAATLHRCLASIGFADQVLLLDSFSDDESPAIGLAHGADVMQQCFRGYAAQKQRAVDLAAHDWIVLLDADEALSAQAAREIGMLRDQGRLSPPGYRLRRREWLAWREPIAENGRWQGPLVRLTDHLRLFHRQHARLGAHPVHARPECAERALLLRGELLHWGDAPFARRLQKQRRYARLLAGHGMEPPPLLPLRRLLAPPAALLRDLLWRRYLLDGPLGWRAAWCSAQCAHTRYRA